MRAKIPWGASDIFHDDPESYPLTDYFPLEPTESSEGDEWQQIAEVKE